MNSQRVLGLLFVALGLALLVATTTDVGGEVVVAALGVGFLIAYGARRNYGFLIPGAILTGLGTGIVVAEQGGPGGSVPLGLGLGFLAIALIDRLGPTDAGPAWWWPLIPGTILTFAGGTDVAGVDDAWNYVIPALLVVLGLWLLVRPRGRGDSRPPSSARRSDDASHGAG